MDELEELYRQYAIPVKRYVLSLCGNEAEADDITAETFYKAIRHIETFEGGRMFTWLCAIARNTWLDRIKRKDYQNQAISEEIEAQLADNGPTPEEAWNGKEERLMLYRHIQKLQPGERDVVYLRIFAELSFSEIGQILNRSENWARVTFYRSKEKLKGWMHHE